MYQNTRYNTSMVNYLFRVNDSVQDIESVAREIADRHGGKVLYVYKYAVRGFCLGFFSELSYKIADSRICYMAKEIHCSEGYREARAPDDSYYSWGLDRISQRELPLNGNTFFSQAGAGAHIYIIDSGIDINHSDFIGRIQEGYTSDSVSTPYVDEGGHGTSVASIAAGSLLGVAKGAALHSMKIAGGGESEFIAILDWLCINHKKPAIVNRSGGFWSSTELLEEALSGLISSGVIFICSAGNSGVPASEWPATSPLSITVGATDIDDKKTEASNYGPDIDIFAPGYLIPAAEANTLNAIVSFGQTSCATPFVTGVAALYLSENPDASQEDVRNFLISTSTKDVLSGIGDGSPNRLLFAQPADAQNVQITCDDEYPFTPDVPFEISADISGITSDMSVYWESSLPVDIISGQNTDTITAVVHSGYKRSIYSQCMMLKVFQEGQVAGSKLLTLLNEGQETVRGDQVPVG